MYYSSQDIEKTSMFNKYRLFVSQLAHPVLESLKGTPHGWLIELLYAFNSGMFYPFNTISYSLHNAALQLSS